MPQMSPMNWLSLFIMFSLSFILFNIMNYFLFYTNLPKSKMNFNYKNLYNSFNWKW